MLELLEYRLDWAHMHMTPELFRYVFLNLIPDVVMHTAKQDLEQVGDNYNREFLGGEIGRGRGGGRENRSERRQEVK